MHKIQSRTGESLVEVMVSAVIFLMMMAILQGSISFCTIAQQKCQQIRDINEEICRNLQTTPYIPGGENKDYLFKATTADGEQPGEEAAVLFSIEAEMGTKEITYTDPDGTSRTTTFYIFGSSDADDTEEAGNDEAAEDTSKEAADSSGGDTP